MNFRVEFKRDFADDMDVIEQNFTGLPENEQLQQQLLLELEDAPVIRSHTTIEGINIGAQQYTITAMIEWESAASRDVARQELRKALQHNYDEFGMAGLFDIKD